MSLDPIMSINRFSTKYIKVKGTPQFPLFKLIDIGNVTGVKNIFQTIKDFEDNDKIFILDNSNGGNQQTRFLTKSGFIKFLSTSRKPIAKKMINYKNLLDMFNSNNFGKIKFIIDEIEHNIISIELQSDEFDAPADNLVDTMPHEFDTKLINTIIPREEQLPTTSTIYVYNCDVTLTNIPNLKIGYSSNLKQRVQSYDIVSPNGKLEYFVELENVKIKIVEQFVHEALKHFLVRNELFALRVDHAIAIISSIANILKLSLSSTHDNYEGLKKSSIISEKILQKCNETTIIQQQLVPLTIGNSHLHDDGDEDLGDSKNDSSVSIILSLEDDAKMAKFIEEMCIVNAHVEIQASKIIGLYRIWCGEAKRSNKNVCVNYLKKNFIYDRIKNSTTQGSTYGFKGITIKHIAYEKQLLTDDTENFIFHKCTFVPDGTAFIKNIVEEYVSWKQNMNKPITENEDKEIMNYFKNYNSHHVIYVNVWSKAHKQSNQGYYGISLNSQMNIKHVNNFASQCKKAVYKIDPETGIEIDTWESIARTADAIGASASKLSRHIKNKQILNGFLYITK